MPYELHRTNRTGPTGTVHQTNPTAIVRTLLGKQFARRASHDLQAGHSELAVIHGRKSNVRLITRIMTDIFLTPPAVGNRPAAGTIGYILHNEPDGSWRVVSLKANLPTDNATIRSILQSCLEGLGD